MLSGTAQEFRIETTRTRSSTFDLPLYHRSPSQETGSEVGEWLQISILDSFYHSHPFENHPLQNWHLENKID